MSGSALLLHGLSSSPEGWWRVRGWLEDAGWRTSTRALLGHGGREAAPRYLLEDYVADVRGSGPFDLVVGHSLGACIATVLAAEDPGWTARLVLVDPVWFIDPADLPAVAADQVAELASTAESLRVAKPHWDERDIAAKAAAVRSADPAAVERTFAGIDAWDLRDAARAIRTPTLVLGGDPDVFALLDPADGFEIAEDVPGMTYEIVPGAGHSPHRDAPDATRSLLMSWLDRTMPA